MARDLQVDDNGDLVIDPLTHDLAIVDGDEEIEQRIKATLDTGYGEMVNLDPKMGADHQSFLGKNFNEDNAAADMTAAIKANVPEVETIDSIKFKKLPRRHLLVTFRATVRNDDNSTDKIKGDYNIGS